MILHNNILYLGTDDFVQLGLYEERDAAIEYIKKLAVRGIETLPHPLDARIKLVSYEDIPAPTQAKLPTYAALLRTYRLLQVMQDLGAKQADAACYYDTLEGIMIGDKDTDKLSKELALSKSLMDWVVEVADAPTAQRGQRLGALGVKTLTELYVMLIDFIKIEAKWEGLKGISTLDSFKCKLTKYRKQGMSALINGRMGLQNSLKMTSEVSAIMGEVYAGTKWNGARIHFELNNKLRAAGMQEVSVSTVKEYVAEPTFRRIYSGERDGKKVWLNEFDPQIKRRPPTHAGMIWVVDGTPMELYYKYKTGDKKTGAEKWTFGRLYVVVVIDAFSWEFVGYSIGYTEGREMAVMAIKNAVRTQGYRPDMFYLDNGSSFSGDLKKWLEEMSHGTYSARVGNARAKIVEPSLKHLWESQAKNWKNFSGMNMTATSQASKVNEEYIRKNWTNFPEKEGLIAQIQCLFGEWNAEPRSAGPAANRFSIVNGTKTRISPTAAQVASVAKHKADLNTVSLVEMVSIFWMWKLQKDHSRLAYSYTNEGIGIKWAENEGEEVWYAVPEGAHTVERYKQCIGNRFYVKYDPDNLLEIAIFESDRFLMLLKKVALVGMATIDYVADDGKRVKAKHRVRKELIAETAAERAAKKELALRVFGETSDDMLRNPLTDDKIAAETRAKIGFGMPTHLHKDDLNEAEGIMKQYSYAVVPSVVVPSCAVETPHKGKKVVTKDIFEDIYKPKP